MQNEMTREQALAFVNRWRLVNDFLAKEIRATLPEVRFSQLRTMVATAHSLRRPGSGLEEESATWERWRLLKELLHV
jgi:hypothetical protein